MATSAPTTPFARYGDHRDRALAARAARGEEEAFAELYDRHASGLLAFATQYVGDRAAAEDVVQQTFMAAYRVISRGTELEHPRAWLYHVTRNNALTAIRDRGAASVDADLAADLHDRAAAVPAQVEQREALEAVVRDIVALPADQRAALTLYELGDLSQAEIAGTLGCAPARVKALVFQARSSLVTQREARDASCESVREKLATFHGGALNQRLIRHHLRGCQACRDYRDELRDKRRRVALLLPVLPMPGLREAVLGLPGHATATASGAGAGALARPGRTRWLAAGTATAALAAGISLAAWPGGEAHHKVSAPVTASAPSTEPAIGPSVRARPPARRNAPRRHRAIHRAPPPPPRIVQPAVPAPVAQLPKPHPVSPPRPPAAKPKPKPSLSPPPPPPVPTLVAQTAPAPAVTPAAPTAPVPSPSPPACSDHSHASAQGLANGKGHHKC